MRLSRFRKAVNLSLILATTVILTTACVEEKDSDVKVGDGTQVESVKVSDVNLSPTLVAFLEARSKSENQAVKTIITENFDSVTGLYAYAAKVTDVSKGTVTIDLGLSTLNVPINKVVAHDNFLDTVSELKSDAEGLAIVTYNNNVVESVEIHQLKHSVDSVRDALGKYNPKTFKAKDAKVKDEDEKNPYVKSSIDDWKGMALLTAREIASKDMAPIFLVPKNSFSKEELLTDTFYYIIVGTLKSSNANETVLVTDTGRTVEMNFGKEIDSSELNTPAWVHVITNEGKIVNTEIQTFKGADIEMMVEGVRGYIEIGSVLNSDNKSE